MMDKISIGDLLWEPSAEIIANANLTKYQKWLMQKKGYNFSSYRKLWRWSVDKPAEFWESLFIYFKLKYSQGWTDPLPERGMPGARWFVGAELNYAENIFAQRTPKDQ